MLDYDTIREGVADALLDRFLRYVRIFTTSDEEAALDRTPSTDCQWDLIRLLEKELKDLGIDEVRVDEHGFLLARIPGNLPESSQVDTIGFMAHVDTNSDAPGDNVQPLVHDPYDGGAVQLGNNMVLDPAEFPLLRKYKGEKLITTDGSTLLGADDKAGIAEIITAAAWLLSHPEIPHGNLEIILTPDEETGSGMNRFPIESLESAFCFTLDGGEEGELEIECYHARKALVTFAGRSIHPGSARGALVNAVSMAGAYISMLPRSESPEATDGRYGNYWAHKIEGGLENAELTVLFRSFDHDDIERREAALRAFGHAVEAAFPGGKVDLEFIDQYHNMREEIDKHPQLLERLRKAYARAGIEPIEKPIRGGTDGSKLTAMGIPTPNIFAGGQNFHSRYEWVALPAMIRAVTVILNLAVIWSES